MANVRVNDYKKLIDVIKSTMYNQSFSKQDSELVKSFLQVLRYSIEFKIMDDCYKNNEYFSSILPNIITLYTNKYNELAYLKEKKANGEYTKFDSIKEKALSITVERLQLIINMINEKDFEHYMEAMNKYINESDQVIELCGNVLESGLNDFNNLFGGKIVSKDNEGHEVIDENGIDSIISILTHPEALKEAEEFFRVSKILHLDELYEKRELDQKFKNYLIIIQDNLEVFRDYMKLIRYSSKRSEQELIACESFIAKSKAELDSLDTSSLFSFRNINRKNQVSNEITKREETIANIKANKERVEELESKIIELGGAGIIDALNTPVSELEETAEAKVSLMLKPLSNNSFNMQRYIDNVTSELASIENEISNKQGEISRKINGVQNTLLKDALLKYPEDVLKVLKLRSVHPDYLDMKEGYGITPFLAALCLKALKDAKNLTYEEINAAAQSVSTHGVSALIESDHGIVYNTFKTLSDEINGITERVPYDTSEYGDLKIA